MKAIAYLAEIFIGKRIHIGILAFISTLYYMRCLAVSASLTVALLSFLLVWAAYLENLTTDKNEDARNPNSPHGLSPAVESALYPFEKFYPFIYLSALTLSASFGTGTFLCTLGGAVIWSSYVQRWFPVKDHREKIRLKEIYIIKNLIPPLGWAFSVVIIPFVASRGTFSIQYIIIVLIVFLFSFREEIKFDIPDALGDKEAGIRTLPNTLSETRTKNIIAVINQAVMLLFFFCLLILIEGHRSEELATLLKNSIPLLATFIFDQRFSDMLFEKKKKEYCNIGVVWCEFLMAVFIVLPYPANAIVYLSLRLAGQLFAFPLSLRLFKNML